MRHAGTLLLLDRRSAFVSARRVVDVSAPYRAVPEGSFVFDIAIARGSRVMCTILQSGNQVEQFRYVPDIDRKFNTSALAAAEPRNFFDQDFGNCAQAAI